MPCLVILWIAISAIPSRADEPLPATLPAKFERLLPLHTKLGPLQLPCGPPFVRTVGSKADGAGNHRQHQIGRPPPDRPKTLVKHLSHEQLYCP